MLINSWPQHIKEHRGKKAGRDQTSSLPWLFHAHHWGAIEDFFIHTGEPPAYQKLLQTHNGVERYESRWMPPNNPTRDTRPQQLPSWSHLCGPSSPMGLNHHHLQQLSGASFEQRGVTAYIGMRHIIGCTVKKYLGMV